MKPLLIIALALNIALTGTIGALTWLYHRDAQEHQVHVDGLRGNINRLNDALAHQTEVANASTGTAQWMSDYILITNDMSSDDADASDIMARLVTICPNKPVSIATPALCEGLTR